MRLLRQCTSQCAPSLMDSGGGSAGQYGARVTFRACVLVRVACQARSFVQHRQIRVAAIPEQWQWNMARRCFVVAADAIVGGMASRAGLSIESGILSMNVVSPAGRMRHRLHDQMTRDALLLRACGRHAVLMAGEAFRIGCARHFRMVLAERIGMEGGLDVAIEVRRNEVRTGG